MVFLILQHFVLVTYCMSFNYKSLNLVTLKTYILVFGSFDKSSGFWFLFRLLLQH